MKVDVLILAGAQNKGALKEYSSQRHEALIEINNKPMVEYVIRAVNNSQSTDRVALVGPAKELTDSLNEDVDILVESAESMIDNIRAGVEKLASNKYILVVTSDIPLISREVVDKYIDLCQEREADIYFPIISRDICEDKFPEVERTYVKLAEGTYTGGNIILMKSDVFMDILGILSKVIQGRKKPWKLSKLLGFKFIIKYFLGRLHLKEIEDRISDIIGYQGKGLIVDYPEVGFDIDKPSDLRLMRQKYSILL